jgi:hypothetical protein
MPAASLAHGGEFGERLPRALAWLYGYLERLDPPAGMLLTAARVPPADAFRLLDAIDATAPGDLGGPAADPDAVASAAIASAALREYLDSLPEPLVKPSVRADTIVRPLDRTRQGQGVRAKCHMRSQPSRW